MGNFAAIVFSLFFIFAMTVSGALAACFVPEKKYSDWLPYLNGLSGGIMIAASVWSLVLPALESAGEYAALKTGAGIAAGGLFILIVGLVFPENEDAAFNRLFLAMTAHNIPEGIAVGFALGSGMVMTGSALSGVSVAIGIGLQNFPEGAAVSLPLRREGCSRRKSFFIGQASGFVEPIAGVLGALLAVYIEAVLPFALSFAAGAMILVAVHELIPECQRNQKAQPYAATMGIVTGFALMMLLDVMLG